MRPIGFVQRGRTSCRRRYCDKPRTLDNIVKSNFKLSVVDFPGDSVETVRRRIAHAYKKPLAELKLFDLLVNEDKNSALRHGTYMFFDSEGHCVYIGMCSSSHFAHRIGGHFGMSPKYGMNTFMKRIVNVLKPGKDETTGAGYARYVDTLPMIAHYSLLIIDASGKGREFVVALERLLHTLYTPRLNFPKNHPRPFNKKFGANDLFLSLLP